MELLVVGLNHKTAPVALRERVALDAAGARTVESAARTLGGADEAVALSTCNRTELYLVGASGEALRDAALACLQRRYPERPERLEEFFYLYRGRAAAQQLLRVSAGLDSLVLGETEILGQVRAAYLGARGQGHAGTVLGRLFEMAIHTGKRVQTETRLGGSDASISHAAVRLAESACAGLAGRTVLVIGAGRMGALVARQARGRGAASVWIANRTPARASALAQELGGRALALERLDEALATAEVAISATGKSGFVLTRSELAQAMSVRGGRPLVLIDIAVPRDIDPAAADLPGITLYNIDYLRQVAQGEAAPRIDLAAAERLVEEGLEAFADWLRERRVAPVIHVLRQAALAVREQELRRWRQGGSPHPVAEASTHGLLNKLLHQPLVQLKALDDEALAATVAALGQLLGLELQLADVPVFAEMSARR